MAEARETLEWKPRGHPVRWAAGVALGIALVSGVSIWFGALSPRVGVHALRWGAAETGGPDVVELQVELTNRAHTDATIVRGGESLPGLTFEGMDLSSRSHGRPDGADRVDSGGGRVFATLRYRVTDCAAIPAEPPAIPIRARTALGVERTVANLHRLEEPDGVHNDAWTIQLTRERCNRY